MPESHMENEAVEVTQPFLKADVPNSTNGNGLHLRRPVDTPVHAASGFRYRVEHAWSQVIAPITKSSHKIPPPTASFWSRLKYDMLLPPTGNVSGAITLLTIAVMVWAALWSVLRRDMLPYGNIFGIYIMVVFALILGYVVELARLAPLLGMLIVGCVMRNVVPIDFTKYIDPTWSSSLRNIALAIILTRAGLGLDIAAIQKRFWVVCSLAAVPTIAITVFITIVAHYMISFPWLFSGALGFLISAVSPAVIVPIMLYFQEQRIGTNKGLPSLIIAAATICDVIAICGNSILLGIGLSSGSLTFNIMAVPLSIIVGIGFGLLAGWFLWYFPSGDDVAATIFRFILLVCGGVFCIFASKEANISGAGAIGALTIPLTAAYQWRKRGYTKSVAAISLALKHCWVIFQPLLFGLIGASVDLRTLIPEKVGMMIGLLFAAHAVQLLAAHLACMCFGFTWKENLFLALSSLAKATIQAAIGSNALDIAIKGHMDDYYIQLGQDTLNCAVLAIIFFAPIGGVTLLLTGGKLLDHEVSSAAMAEAAAEAPVADPVLEDQDDLHVAEEAFVISPRRHSSVDATWRQHQRYSSPLY